MKRIIDIPDNYDLSKIQNGSIASKIILDAVKNGSPLDEPDRDLLNAISKEITSLPSELTEDGRRLIRRGDVFRIIEQYRGEEDGSI